MDLGIRVRDLLASPRLELRVLCGEGGLDNRMSWAQVHELEDPTPWLVGAELVMTSGKAIPAPARRQKAYLERLAVSGAAGLVVSAQLFGPDLHPVFFETATALSFPVLTAPTSVPFVLIIQEVAGALQSDHNARLRSQIAVYDSLRSVATEGWSPPELMARLEDVAKCSLYACTRQIRPLFEGVALPPRSRWAEIPDTLHGAPGIVGGYVLPVPAPGGPAGFLFALQKPAGPPPDLTVMQQIATVLAFELARSRYEREIRRREGAEVLSSLLSTDIEPVAAKRSLSLVGFDPSSHLRLVVLQAPNGPPDDVLISRMLDEASATYLMLRRGLDLLVLIPDTSQLWPLELTGTGLCAGSSLPIPAGTHLGVAMREADWAAARARGLGVQVLTYGDDPVGRWLRPDDASLSALVGNVLGPALDYDISNNSRLVATVRTWLEVDRNYTRAAKLMKVHVNTLRYRIHQFEKVTRRKLVNTADIVEIWLAFRAMSHVADSADSRRPSRVMSSNLTTDR
jgi:PucR family transcriptional regulator, purine catabolism regulatory protein